MRAVSLQPAAGAHGELTGILMIRAYHRADGDIERDEVLVPDSSHGTNPATATMAGFRTITIPSARRRRRRRRRVPGGARAADGGGHDHEPVHARACSRSGSASCSTRSTRPARWPTWTARTSTRSSAGSSPARPASTSCTSTCTRRSRRRTAAAARAPGPVAVGEKLLPFLPDAARPARADDGTFRLERPGERPTSIGRLRSFVGSTGVLVRAYAYLRAHGGARPAPGQRRRGPRGELPQGARRRGLRHPVRPARASTSSSRRRRRSSGRPASGRSTSRSA